MTENMEAAITAACYGYDYYRRRDVKLRLATAGGQSAWVAVRDGQDYEEVSDFFPADASDEYSALFREQAYVLAREHEHIGLDEARYRISGRRHHDGSDPSRKRRNKWAK